ncbi:MAG: hypothetical protein HY776_01470 [Actinobacteria bacterium]|nr:hypothetical protein [Actinomycetota bacterium]
MKERVKRTKIQLKYLILVCASFAFVSLLIYNTHKFEFYWYLYSIPVFIAAFTYNMPGALVAGLTSIFFIIWWMYEGILYRMLTGDIQGHIYETTIGSSM